MKSKVSPPVSFDSEQQFNFDNWYADYLLVLVIEAYQTRKTTKSVLILPVYNDEQTDLRKEAA